MDILIGQFHLLPAASALSQFSLVLSHYLEPRVFNGPLGELFGIL